MGASQYLGLTRQRAHGVGDGGEPTDAEGAELEDSREEEREEDDMEVEDTDTVTGLISLLRDEMGWLFSREQWLQAALFQGTILKFLDNVRDRNLSSATTEESATNSLSAYAPMSVDVETKRIYQHFEEECKEFSSNHQLQIPFSWHACKWMTQHKSRRSVQWNPFQQYM
eukprot:s119_g56.t1